MARKMITELYPKVMEQSGLDVDHRFKSYIKIVTGVNEAQTNGYAFEGEFLKKGTIEFEVQQTVYLCMAVSGSAEYNSEYYAVVTMDADGNLTKTDIETDSKTPGWALRIRGQVKELLAKINSDPAADAQLGDALASDLTSISTSDLILELARRGIVVALG